MLIVVRFESKTKYLSQRNNVVMMFIHINLFAFFQIEGLDDLENEIDDVLCKLEKKWARNLLHTVAFY